MAETKKAAKPEASSSSGIDPKTANLLSGVSYIIPLIGLIFLIIIKKGENDFARFHSAQSLGLWVVYFIVSIVMTVIGGVIAIIPFIGWLIGALIALAAAFLYLIFLVVAIFCLYKTVAKNEKYKLPMLGNFVEGAI